LKLPILSSKELCLFLEKQGFIAVRQKGSHRFYRHLDGRSTVVPMHSGKNIKKGLLSGILHQIKMSRDEFFDKWK